MAAQELRRFSILHLQIHQLGRKHHIVVQICHDQKRSDDDKSDKISEVNTLNRSRARRWGSQIVADPAGSWPLAENRNDCSWPFATFRIRQQLGRFWREADINCGPGRPAQSRMTHCSILDVEGIVMTPSRVLRICEGTFGGRLFRACVRRGGRSGDCSDDANSHP
jgi:hypothetical protein